ncbi:hypothetical protein V5799_016559 [Amblyomma americanum]|uniref:Uncharacterized protein n=1 Tax=Amblyomma americanum TaxID=6943 RepID=A0AAQ4F4S3_AMBAM
MAALKGDPLTETAQQTAQRQSLAAKKVKAGAEVHPCSPPQKQFPASPPAVKTAAPATKDAAAAGKAPVPKTRPLQPKEQRAPAPEAVGAAGADIVVPIPQEVQSPKRPVAADTFQSHTPEEDARVLNYRRLSHFRHRRYQPRAKYGCDPRHGGSSLWNPEGKVSTKTKQQSEVEAAASTQPLEFILENYVRPPEGPVEPEMGPVKVICIGAGLVVIILAIAAWVVMAVRRVGRQTTQSEEYDNQFGFSSINSNDFFSTNTTVRGKSLSVEGDYLETSEVT